MKKQTKKLVSLLMALGMTLGATACGGGGGGKGGSDSVQTLDIYVLVHGYGQDWLDSAIARFKKADWVKEKYPELQINKTFDSVDATAHQKLTAGEAINKYDLMYGVNLQGYETKGLIADLTDSVFLSEVPGETGTKVIEKLPQRFLDRIKNATAPARQDGNDSYFVVPYAQGLFGMMYNYDLLVDQLKLEVPLTTDQFLATAASIQTKKYNSDSGEGLDTVLMHHSGDNYWSNAFPIWWAQYEGTQGYANYFEGYDPEEEVKGSVTVLDQKGRLRSLQVIEDILTKYSYEYAESGNYKQNQTKFLMGEGIFHFNGDYFAAEMKDEIEGLGDDNYDIRFMKMPVVSAIIEKATSIKDDAQLAAVIKEIDNDVAYANSQAKANGVTEADFNVIVEARGVAGGSSAGGHTAVIPSYAAAKDLAADFLRFMYTDESIKDFTTSTGGLLFPSTYDIMNDMEVMAKVNPIQKTKMDIFRGTSNYEFKYMVAPGATTLGRNGLEALYFPGSFEVYFRQGKAENTAEAILAQEKDHWNESAWGQLVR